MTRPSTTSSALMPSTWMCSLLLVLLTTPISEAVFRHFGRRRELRQQQQLQGQGQPQERKARQPQQQDDRQASRRLGFYDYYEQSGGKKGGGGSGGKKSSYSSCDAIHIFVYNEDLQAGFFTNDVGDGFDQVPFYDFITGQVLGTYSEAGFDTTTNSSIATSSDCVYTGAFSFDYVEDLDMGMPGYLSQINIASTCQAASDSITGGSGSFGCASGYSTSGYEDDEITAAYLYLCGDLCPQQTQHYY